MSDDTDERLLFADLHNHTMLSDGDGDPRTAFAQLRAAGLDVAALTDHASIPRHLVGGVRDGDEALGGVPPVRTAPASLDDAEWAATGRLADVHDDPGSFTAIRGFEWTDPGMGHINVWFSDRFLPVTTPGSVRGLHDWLVADQPHALLGYNHPGREDGRFENFRHEPRLVRRMVSLEMFNRYDDYVAVGVRGGRPSPLLACLRAGWRPGLVGVSDEHGRDYGLRGKGRTGLWVAEHSRSGVASALLGRRVYATREPELRLRASLDGAPMGSSAAGTGEITVSLDATERWSDVDVVAQVLVDDGDDLPRVLSEEAIDPTGTTSISVPGVHGYPWAVLRVAAPDTTDRSVRLSGHPLGRRALAYGSPWWLGASD